MPTATRSSGRPRSSVRISSMTNSRLHCGAHDPREDLARDRFVEGEDHGLDPARPFAPATSGARTSRSLWRMSRQPCCSSMQGRSRMRMTLCCGGPGRPRVGCLALRANRDSPRNSVLNPVACSAANRTLSASCCEPWLPRRSLSDNRYSYRSVLLGSFLIAGSSIDQGDYRPENQLRRSPQHAVESWD
jgi:hypothetical protein